MRIIPLILCGTILALPIAYAADGASTDASAAGRAELIDAVVAVVNDDVITRYELDDRIRIIVRQLQKQGTPLPGPEILERQILERMINDMMLAQYAKESGIRVSDTQLDQTIARIAQQSDFSTLSEFRAKLEADGVNYKKFREEIRGELISNRLREREIESKLVISDNEVDNYLANKNKTGNGDEFHLAHILVVVPEQASAEKIQAAQERAVAALNQIKDGADFAQVAAGSSDANDALKGGNLGWRFIDRIPPLYANELANLQPGQTTRILRSTSGFHILKLVEKRSGNEPVVISQAHVRHILIKTSEIVSDSAAKSKLMEIKQRIDAGADFAEQAKQYSQDGSAAKGGDLDWISPGQTVPEFEEAMNKLEPGMTGIAQTQFGWHLIQIQERRNTDVSVLQQRQQARVAIGNFKSDEQYQDWLRQLRDRAFVEYRIEQ